MIKRILTICAAVALGAAGTSLAHAQQGYPVPPGSVYSDAPGPYPPGGYAVDERRPDTAAPDFDALDDDDAPNAPSSAALPPPGPVLSPNDPRYGRPMGAPAPVYSERAVPTGPILSPDDPRYGRPAGPPPVIYYDRRGRHAAGLSGSRQRRSGCRRGLWQSRIAACVRRKPFVRRRPLVPRPA